MTVRDPSIEGYLLDRPDKLAALRALTDLSCVTIDTTLFKYRRLLPLALRYAYWAVAPGGRIVIRDHTGPNPQAPAFEAPFNMVRQWVFKTLGRDAEVAGFDPSGRIELVRRTPVAAGGWSAGVVFSGRDGELADLRRCLDGLMLQPELSRAQGGEIVVSAPPGARPDWFDLYPDVRCLDYETPPGARFLIGRKKNALIEALRGPRVAILHARIVLSAGALAAVPREFDILSPNVFAVEGGVTRTYLSLASAPEPTLGALPKGPIVNLRNIPSRDPLALHSRGGVFVDGGCFFTTRALHAECPLDDALGWEEGEDLEWCARALAHGYISDIALGAHAVSSTSKYRPRPKLGILETPAEQLVRGVRQLRARAVDSLGRMAGRR